MVDPHIIALNYKKNKTEIKILTLDNLELVYTQNVSFSNVIFYLYFLTWDKKKFITF